MIFFHLDSEQRAIAPQNPSLCGIDLIQDEYHLLCQCPLYQVERHILCNYIPNFKSSASNEQFIKLMTHETRFLTKYVENGWTKRNDVLNITLD